MKYSISVKLGIKRIIVKYLDHKNYMEKECYVQDVRKNVGKLLDADRTWTEKFI